MCEICGNRVDMSNSYTVVHTNGSSTKRLVIGVECGCGARIADTVLALQVNPQFRRSDPGNIATDPDPLDAVRSTLAAQQAELDAHRGR